MGFSRKSHDLWKSVSHFYEKKEYNYNMWLEMIQTIKINRNKVSRLLIVWLSCLCIITAIGVGSTGVWE